MHIILMLAGMIIGLSIGTKTSWILGLPVMAGCLFFLEMGTATWRERQEAFALCFGLCCGAFILIVSIFS